jgi:hypothetical protein
MPRKGEKQTFPTFADILLKRRSEVKDIIENNEEGR